MEDGETQFFNSVNVPGTQPHSLQLKGRSIMLRNRIRKLIT